MGGPLVHSSTRPRPSDLCSLPKTLGAVRQVLALSRLIRTFRLAQHEWFLGAVAHDIRQRKSECMQIQKMAATPSMLLIFSAHKFWSRLRTR